MKFALNICMGMRFPCRKRFSIVKNAFLEDCIWSRVYSVFGHTSTYINFVLTRVDLMKYTDHGWKLLRKIFGVYSMQIGLKCTHKPDLKIWAQYLGIYAENASGYDTGSLPLTERAIYQIIRFIMLNWKRVHAKFL